VDNFAVFEFLLTAILAAAVLGRLVPIARVLVRSQGLPSLAEISPVEDGPDCSILIPVRDEAQTIGPCLASLSAQSYGRIEILVVDDDSSDGTARIVQDAARRDPRIRYLKAPPLPAGWTGKNFALALAGREAQGTWLLLTDADTVHAPSALARVLGYAQLHDLACLSLSPEQECRGFWERLIQPVVCDLLDQTYPMVEVNNPTSPGAAAHGAFLLIRREVYDAVGGHERLRGELLEDVALARAVKERGERLCFAPANGLVRSRMYRSFTHLREGWTKNLYLLMGGRPGRAVRVAGTLLWTGCVPALIILTLSGLAVAGITAGLLLPWALGAAALLLLVEAFYRKVRGHDPLIAWSHPLGVLFVVWFLLESTYRNLSGRGVTWKARVYAGGSPWQS